MFHADGLDLHTGVVCLLLFITVLKVLDFHTFVVYLLISTLQSCNAVCCFVCSTLFHADGLELHTGVVCLLLFHASILEPNNCVLSFSSIDDDVFLISCGFVL